MGLMVTATASIDRDKWRKTNKGLQKVEVGPAEYSAVKDGEKHVRLTGYADPFEIDGQYGKSTCTRIEFLILEPAKLARQRFDVLVTLKVGPRSNLGKIVTAARNQEIEVGEEIDIADLLNNELWVTTEGTEKDGRTQISIVACRPLDDDDVEVDPADDDEPPI